MLVSTTVTITKQSFSSRLLTKRFMLLYIFMVFLAGAFMSFLAVTQSIANSNVKGPRFDEVFEYYNLVRVNSTVPRPYVVFAPFCLETQIYCIYGALWIAGANIVVAYFTVIIMKTLKTVRHNMTPKTYLLNKQINQLLYIQVSTVLVTITVLFRYPPRLLYLYSQITL